MSSPDFCWINDTFFYSIDKSISFVQGRDYVLRFVVDGWETKPPASHKLFEIVKRAFVVMAVCNELGLYQVKAVLMRQVDAGEQVRFYEPATFMSGPGCNSGLVASDGTWVFDVVFQAKASETSITAVQKWKQYLAMSLPGPSGTPTVKIAGLVDLCAECSNVPGYAEAVAFWQGVQPCYEVVRGGKDPSNSQLYSATVNQINKDGPAWAKQPSYVGQNGVGIAMGDAFDPTGIQPISISAAVQPTLPSSLPPSPPGTPEILFSAQNITPTQKGFAIAAGIFAGWAFGKLVLRW